MKSIPRLTLSPRTTFVVIVLVILTCYLLVWPVGPYPVEDDWAYVKSLEYLHHEGQLKILDWNPMTLVAHLAWGVLFTKPLGFGFTVAKISTVSLLLLECLALAGFLRLLRCSERSVLLATLVLIFSPIHFFQSFLYATDIPTLAWTMVAVYSYSKALAFPPGHGLRWLLCGSVAGSLAFGCRQPGILPVIGLGVYLVLFERRRLTHVRSLVAAFAIPLLAIGVFQWWYKEVHGPTSAYEDAKTAILGYWRSANASDVVKTAYVVLTYLALFLLPLILSSPSRSFWPRGRARWIGAGLCGGMVAAFVTYARAGEVFPYIRNKISHFGFLSPNEVVLGDREVLWTDAVGWPLSGVLLLAACGLLLSWMRGFRAGSEDAPDDGRRAALTFVSVVLALQGLYLVSTVAIAFDRHLILALPVALALFIGSQGPRVRHGILVYLVLLLPLAFYGVASTHDFHAISRTIARAGDDLITRGIDPQYIDAGYAFDGWHMYERSLRETQEEGLPRRRGMAQGWWVASLCPRIQPEYVVSLSETLNSAAWAHELRPGNRDPLTRPSLAGYSVVDQYTYRSYWPLGRKEVFVLKSPYLSGIEDRRRRPGTRAGTER